MLKRARKAVKFRPCSTFPSVLKLLKSFPLVAKFTDYKTGWFEFDSITSFEMKAAFTLVALFIVGIAATTSFDEFKV